MLTVQENELFTRIGPGTPMGELLRRYWHPVGCSQQLEGKPRRVKVLGEELVLYRDADGRPALIELRCAHRGVALDYGRVEGDCIRCSYHGWLYDRSGRCVEQPAEPEGSSFKDKVQLKAYQTQEFGGLIFGYLGPEPAPLLPHFDLLRMTDGVKHIQVQRVNANWLNHVENIVDISHLAWLHGYTFPAYGARKITYHWDRKPYGVDNVMRIEGLDEPHISCYGFPTVNRFAVPAVDPNGELVRSMIYRVPIDDESMLLYFVRFYPSDKPSFKTTVRESKYGEYTPLEKDWWGIDGSDQDRMVVEQQGVIANRQNEHLGVSDGGIILMRQMLREGLAAVAEDKDPPCVIRDPALQAIDFPQQSSMMTKKQEGVVYGRYWADSAMAVK
jgi:5,5'-dehydrodivanillate O-demethylase